MGLSARYGLWDLEKREGGPECLYKYIDNLGIMSKKKKPTLEEVSSMSSG